MQPHQLPGRLFFALKCKEFIEFIEFIGFIYMFFEAVVLPLALEMPKFLSMVWSSEKEMVIFQADVKSYPVFGTLGHDLEFVWARFSGENGGQI